MKTENHIGNILFVRKSFTPVVGEIFDNVQMITGTPALIRNISGNTQYKYIIRFAVGNDGCVSVAVLITGRYLCDIGEIF